MTPQRRDEDRRPPAVALMGPTACGKTEFAVALVQQLPLDIVSVDSALVYRGMDIGTAKPGAEVLTMAPHRLIDIVDPVEAYSAARFRDDALREMAEIRAAGRVPLLVGGTMLYFRALQRGLAQLPSADPEVRAEIAAQARRYGWARMHEELRAVDPESAARIHPNDPQRIQRALEVQRLSGRTLSSLTRAHADTEPPVRLLKLALIDPDRSALRMRIADRFRRMLAAGLVGEVEGLRQRGDLTPDLPSMRAVGYRQVWDYLDGRLAYDGMVEGGMTATAQLAKRQMTWLRAEQNLHCYEPLAAATLEQMRARIAAWLHE